MIDTPGLLNKGKCDCTLYGLLLTVLSNAGQLTSKLTTEELKKVIPVKPIKAVTLRLEEGRCVLLGGLATIELAQVRGSRYKTLHN